jgi:hypothetical protein
MPTTKLGLPCWHKENVEQAIRPIARTDEEGVDYFLASHSPVGNIRHDRTGEEFNEESLFKILFSSKSEVLALVHGDPGTGKSHLIHWLKLRTEDELRRRKIKNTKAVLIQRRTGSLKDALEQMIEQLGEDFKDYLSPVREALSKISSDIAREKFVDSIAIELRPQQRADKKREPLPRRLKDLAEVCHSQGFRNWLCRENGISDKVVKQLTEKKLSETEDFAVENNSPQFTSAELLPDTIYRKAKDNTETVRNLIEDLEFEEDLLEQAVKFFNEVLPDAIKEMTGLSGTNLRSIFDRIRTDLKKRGEMLALFIEDVSVMSALDEEVFTAVEPQTRNDLCRMIAVLGSTNQGLNRLMDNQKDRITHPISLGDKANADWQTDTQAVAEFTARYLNTVRLSREEISAVAAYRRDGGDDINISACNHCPVRDNCHAHFGKTQVGTVEVGLFPFSVIAPRRLLKDLSGKFATQKTARGLLTQILLPALDSNYESLQIGKFPNADKFAVVRHEVSFWGPFKQMYCGGWEEPEIRRLEFLAQGWVRAENADELAAQLSPFLAPFNFPEFSKRTTKASKTITISEIERAAEQQKPVEPAINPKLNKIRQSLKNWVEGEKLTPDGEPRELLAGLIRNSIAWNDFDDPPLEEWRRLLGVISDDEETISNTSRLKFVKIEDQTSEPANAAIFINFPRDEETRSLIEALAQFRYAGNKSWSFEYGEYHKRVVAQWLRRHQSQIIEQLKPPSDLNTSVPIDSAVQILSTGALVRQRTKLPPELPELLKLVLTDNWTEEPFALSNEWRDLINDMRLKHKDMLRFLTNEVNVPQGRTGGINFINSIPILTAALDFAAAPKIQILSDDYFQRFWKSRYSTFQNKSKYANFFEALRAERAAIGEVLENIELGLRGFGYDTENLPEALVAFCADLTDLLKTQTEAKETYPYTPFEDLGRGVFANRKDVWQTAVKRAQIVVAEEDVIQTLTFNPQTLKEAENALSIAFDYVSRVENYVKNRLQNFEQEGDPDLLKAAIFESLENIEQMRS